MKCPSFEQLIDFLDNRLSGPQAERVRAHLATVCPECAETRAWYERVQTIAASDDTVAPPPWVLKRALRIFDSKPARPRLVERIGQRVASLVFDSFARPAIAGVRSTETTNRQLLYRAGDYSIDLQIAPAEHEQADIIGQILRQGESAFQSVAELALVVTRDGREVLSTTTDEMGEFEIRGLDYGSYDLRVEMGDASITIAGLSVSQS